jgi:hypothetical protein
MASEVEIWWGSPPPVAAVALALESFGTLLELPGGALRLVEGDEDPGEGVPMELEETAEAPEAVLRVMDHPRAVLRASAVLSGSRGFWLVRVAAQVQKRLGGLVHLPSSGETFDSADRFEASWPPDHGGHGGHGEGPGGHDPDRGGGPQ